MTLALLLAIGCAALAVSQRFMVYVENDTFDDVRVHTSTGFYLGTVRAGESVGLRAVCADFMRRRTGFSLTPVISTARPYPLIGEYITACSDSLVVRIPAAGVRRASVTVR